MRKKVILEGDPAGERCGDVGLDSRPEGQRSGGCVHPWGVGQVLLWGWVGQALTCHSKEFKHDFVDSLEAATGFRLESDMAGFKFNESLRC